MLDGHCCLPPPYQVRSAPSIKQPAGEPKSALAHSAAHPAPLPPAQRAKQPLPARRDKITKLSPSHAICTIIPHLWRTLQHCLVITVLLPPRTIIPDANLHPDTNSHTALNPHLCEVALEVHRPLNILQRLIDVILRYCTAVLRDDDAATWVELLLRAAKEAL